MKKYNYRFKKVQKTLIADEEEKAKFFENFNELKNKLNVHDASNINDWSSYKKKDNSLIKSIKKNKEKNPLKLGDNKLNKLILNMLNKNNKNEFFKKNYYNKFINIDFVLKKFIKINIKKMSLIKNNNYYSLKNIIFFIIDMRSLKSKLIVFNKTKCLISMTNGIMFKKMQFNNKKYKKSEKLTFLSLKNILLRVNFFKNFNNVVIHIKGAKNSTNNIINYLDKNINNYNLKNKKIVFINDYRMSFNKYFKFKKIKAIKRKLKKKFIKSN